jgi:hypothetical protein
VTVTVTSTTDGTGTNYQYSLTGAFRKLIGDGAPPENPSFVFLTGIEQGVASPTNTGVFSSATGAVSADTSPVRNGSYSLEVAPTSFTPAYAQADFPSTASVTVARFAVRLSSLPSSDRNLASLLSSSGNAATLAYQSSSQRLGVRWGTSGSITAASTTVSSGTWYLIEMRANFGSNPRTLVWRINSVAQANISSSETASVGSGIRFGSSSTGSYTAYFDDIAVSQTASDYGFGDGQVLGLVPDGMGSHNNSFNFQNELGGSISSSTYQRVDDIPASSTSEYIRQVSSSSSSYIEMTIGDQGQTCVDGVSAAVAYASSSTGFNSGQTRIYDGSTITTVQSGNMSSSGTSLAYASSIVTPAGGTWSKTALNGLKARVGYSSDVSPQPRWHALTLEYNLPLISDDCDFDAPTVSRAIVARSDGNGSAGQVRMGTGYYVYAYVTDPGTNPSGVASVTADVSSFDSGVTAASMSSGSWTVNGQTYNYRSSSLTADTPLVMGASYSYSIAAADAAGNAGSGTGYNATVEKYSDVILASSGLLDYYQLSDTSSSYATDTFQGAAGASLTSRSGELNASWSSLPNNSTTAILTSSNRLRRSGTSIAAYYASAIPASANYSVEADVYVASLLSNDQIGVTGRSSTGSETFYMARYSVQNAQWDLIRVVNGSFTTLGYYDQTLAVGTAYRVRLEMSGTTIRLYVGGVQRVSATDSSISQTGRGGLRLGSSTSSQTDSTGLQLNNWVLNSGAPAAADSQGSNDGSYFNAVQLNVAGAIAGSLDAAAKFDGVDSYTRVTRQVSSDFTIEFWFKSTQGRNTNGQWWGNAGLVDAEVDGQANDFGVSLRSDGRIVAGVGGGSDTSITSTSGGFNNGAWHHVVFRRTRSSGALSLYVDGSLQASGTGSTATLSASTYFRFGSIQTGTYLLDGSLDEVAIYDSVISTSTIADHFESGRGY